MRVVKDDWNPTLRNVLLLCCKISPCDQEPFKVTKIGLTVAGLSPSGGSHAESGQVDSGRAPQRQTGWTDVIWNQPIVKVRLGTLALFGKPNLIFYPINYHLGQGQKRPLRNSFFS